MTYKKEPSLFAGRTVILCAAFCSFSIALLLSCEQDEFRRAPTFLVHHSPSNFSVVASEENVQTIHVRVLDADSVPLAGIKVYFTVTEGKGVFVDSIATSDADGIATAQMTPDTKAGNVVVKVQAEKLLQSPVFFYFNVVSGNPSKIEVQSGDNQEARENTRLPNLLYFKVSDAFGNPVANVPVSFSIKSGGGILSISSTNTINGIVAVEFTTGQVTPVTTITASAGTGIETEATVYTLLPVQTHVSRSGHTHLTVTWSKSTSPNFQKYRVYRSRSGYYDWIVLAEVSNIDVTSFEDTQTNIGFRYDYYVRVDTKSGNNVSSNQPVAEAGNFIKLNSAEETDICLDTQNGIFYVTVYRQNKILLISASTFEKTDSIMLDNIPGKIALNNSFTKLYVIYTGGLKSFDVIDLASKNIIHTADLSSILVTSARDIYMTTNGQLFVSGRYIVRIDESNNYAAQKVAGDRNFSDARITFLGDDGQFLYAEISTHSPNDLFKLDLSQAGVPLVLEDAHGSVSATYKAQLSPDGSKLYMREGQIVRASDFATAGNLTDKIYAVAVTSEKVFTCTAARFATGSLNTINAATLAIEKQQEVGFLASTMIYYNNALFAIAELGSSSGAWRFFKIDMN